MSLIDLIPAQFRLAAAAGAAISLLAGAAAAGWTANGWQLRRRLSASVHRRRRRG